MWKNLTAPNLHFIDKSSLCPIPNPMMISPPKQNELHRAELLSNKIRNREEIKVNDIEEISRSVEYESRGSLTFSQGKSNKYLNPMDRSHSQVNLNSRKQDFILNELEENEKLRLHLFKAEKTLHDLATVCSTMKLKMDNLISDHQNEVCVEEFQFEDKKDDSKIYLKYCELVDFVCNYTKDVSFLTKQYKLLEEKSEQYKKYSSKSKKSQEHLIRMLQQSNIKMEQTEVMIQKMMNDVKERDHRIEEYQKENKKLKIGIIELNKELEEVKREKKMLSKDANSYKEVAKELKQELEVIADKLREAEMVNKKGNEKGSEEKFKKTEDKLKKKIAVLDEELESLKSFNESLMKDYKRMSSIVENSEDKLATNLIYQEKIDQYQKCITILQKEKELKPSQIYKVLSKENELDKLKSIKLSLEKELAERAIIVSKLEQELTRWKEKYECLQLDMETRLQQKEKQVNYLQELKSIENERNSHLTEELHETRSDMRTIIDQLKVKELEAEKYRSIEALKTSKIYESLKNCSEIEGVEDSYQYEKVSDISPFQENSDQTIVWKKLRKVIDSGEKEYNNSLEPKNLNMLGSNQGSTATTPKFKNFKFAFNLTNADYPAEERIHTLENKKEYGPFHRAKEGMEYGKKFNLQAFQNKILEEDNSRMFMKVNKTTLR